MRLDDENINPIDMFNKVEIFINGAWVDSFFCFSFIIDLHYLSFFFLKTFFYIHYFKS